MLHLMQGVIKILNVNFILVMLVFSLVSVLMAITLSDTHTVASVENVLHS